MYKRNLIYRLYHPPVFQGRKKRDNYFEGWYFKLVNQQGNQIWSIIPGISYSKDSHGFIQLMHAQSGQSYYHRFPIESFSHEKDSFQIKMDSNSFSDHHLSLNLESENLQVQGELRFRKIKPFPVKPFSPGIMGWYAFVPFMECYHGVVSMQHQLEGSLEINGSMLSFDGGRGYIEKDWGKSMPSDWIWMQSNHFRDHQDSSFMLSLARIPWMKGYFPGFLSFLQLDGQVIRFATYNGSKVEALRISEKEVKVNLIGRKLQLEVTAYRQDGGMLKAPRHGAMDREIQESIISSLELVLKNRNGKILYRDRGFHAGLEIVGDMMQYY